jgi:hypothetical protein
MGEGVIVWSLFDSETDTVKKTLVNHEVYSFGIGSGTQHIHMDLSDFEAVKSELEKYPKPDVIFASPPCETWILITVGKIKSLYTKEKGINLYWKRKWEPFDFTAQQKARRLNGVNTALTTVKIIKHFNPKFWAIENGNSSLIFDYINEVGGLFGCRNKCNYYSYGFNIFKPTIIHSNLMLILKNIKPSKYIILKHCTEYYSEYSQSKKKPKNTIGFLKTKKERSLVPPNLIISIMNQFLKAAHNKRIVN